MFIEIIWGRNIPWKINTPEEFIELPPCLLRAMLHASGHFQNSRKFKAFSHVNLKCQQTQSYSFDGDCVTSDDRIVFSLHVLLAKCCCAAGELLPVFRCFAKQQHKPPDKQVAALSHPLKLFIAYLLSPAVGDVLPAICQRNQNGCFNLYNNALLRLCISSNSFTGFKRNRLDSETLGTPGDSPATSSVLSAPPHH